MRPSTRRTLLALLPRHASAMPEPMSACTVKRERICLRKNNETNLVSTTKEQERLLRFVQQMELLMDCL